MNALTVLDTGPSSTIPIERQSGGIRLSWIVGLLLGWIAADNVLLFGFLGFGVQLAIAASVVIGGGIAALTIRAAEHTDSRVNFSTLLVCLGLATGLLILGGEGRFLYANADWQIRDALLADMGNHLWPFVTQIGGMEQILRAPIGMYLKPALIGGASQSARDMALLGCNAMVLGGLLAIGSVLFKTGRARLVAFAVFFLFSGMDIVGTIIMQLSGEPAVLDHIELWVSKSQFSSHVTMAFWVPQHAIAGWLCAILLLLWRRGLVPLGAFAAAIPLVAIWSPLAIMGAIPFALFAGIETLLQRKIRSVDVLMGVFALVVAVGSLMYLRAGSEAVVTGLTGMTGAQYALVLLLEIIPFSALLLANWRRIGFGLAIPALAVISLILMPLYCIGTAIDFQMRASIVPLAIMALGIVQVLVNAKGLGTLARPIVTLLLLIGACTPALEIRRALVTAPSPVPQCSLIDTWHQQSGPTIPDYAVYYAPVSKLPTWMRNAPQSRIAPAPNPRCWTRYWEMPRG